MYVGLMPGMKKGDTVGHEFLGVVEAVGPDVRSVAPGDRAVAAFDIACGRCVSEFCRVFSARAI